MGPADLTRLGSNQPGLSEARLPWLGYAAGPLAAAAVA
jgi:hypothetical protein